MQLRPSTPRPANYSSVTLAVTQGDACTPGVRTYLGPKPVRITRVTEENAPRFRDSSSQSAFVCPVVSRRHALVTFSDTGAVYLTDTNSHHGTVIARPSGSRSIPATTTTTETTTTTSMAIEPGARTKLEHGDIVTFGKTVVKDNIPHEPVVVRISIRPVTPPAEPVKISPGRYGLFDSDDSSSESVSEDEHESDPDHEDEHEYGDDDDEESEANGEGEYCERDDDEEPATHAEKPVALCLDSDSTSECDYGVTSPSWYAFSGSPQQQALSLPRFADCFGPSTSAFGAHASLGERSSNEIIQLTQAPPLPRLESESEEPLNPGFGQGSAEEKLYGSIGTKEPVPPTQSEAAQPLFPPSSPATAIPPSPVVLPPPAPLPSMSAQVLLPPPPIRAPLPLYFNSMPSMPPMPMPPAHFVPLPPSFPFTPPGVAGFAPFESGHHFDPVTGFCSPSSVRFDFGLHSRGAAGPGAFISAPALLPHLPAPNAGTPVPRSTEDSVQSTSVVGLDAAKSDADDADSGSDMDVGSDSEEDSDSDLDSGSGSDEDEDMQTGMGGGQDPMAWASLRQTYGVSVERDEEEESDSDAEGEEEDVCVESASALPPAAVTPIAPAVVAPAPASAIAPMPVSAPAPAADPVFIAPLVPAAPPSPVASPVPSVPVLFPVHSPPEPAVEMPLAMDVQALEDELARSRDEVRALREALNAVEGQVRILTAAPPSPAVTMTPSTPPRKRTLADLEADDIDATPAPVLAPAPVLPPTRVKRRKIGLVASAAVGAVATYVGLAFF